MRANLTPTHCNVQTQSSEKCITDTFYEAKCAWNAWKNPIVAAAVQSVTLCAQCVRYCGSANYSVTCCIIFRLSLPLSSPIRCIWWDIQSILIIKSKKRKGLRLSGAGVVHSCEQIQKRCPLGRSDTLAHVDDAVHGDIRVGFYQAGAQENVQTVINDFSKVRSLINGLLWMCQDADNREWDFKLGLTKLNGWLGIISGC